jgi:hypothetical protein
MIKTALLLLSLLLASCSARYSPIYWGSGEWVSNDIVDVEKSSTATFDYSSIPWVIITIDGANVGEGYLKAILSPGKHQLEYADYPAEFGIHPKGLMEIDLIASHVYEFQIKYCYWCSPRKYSVWVDDKMTGELVWGKRPDWPSWWL